ncbi:DeoR family transcriptional regulator, partial [Microbacterium sp. K35]
MLVTERRERILALTRDRGTASIGELAATLQVSEMTVRRDIDQLAEEGAVERIRGGVRVRGPQRLLPAPAISDERRAIVAAAAAL